MPRICVFDVNETWLDLRALDAQFARVFGDVGVRQAWFTQMLQNAFVATVTGPYRDFGTLGAAALEMVAARRGVPITPEDKHAILSEMRRLPPHPETQDALARLRQAGLRLGTLTHSTAQVAEAQMTNAGLSGYFEQLFSADAVQRLKPAPEPYRMVADRLGVAIGDLRLIAAHAWDIARALRAGCATAFVARPGMVLDPLVERPDVVGRDLLEVAEQILALENAQPSN